MINLIRNKIGLCTTILAVSMLNVRAFAQDYNVKADKLQKLADSLSNVGEYRRAATLYLSECQSRTMVPYKKNSIINAGFCYAHADMPDSALYCLTKAVKNFGFRNSEWLNSQPYFAQMRQLAGYKTLKNYMYNLDKKQRNPLQAIIITRDIDLFWKVYDKYLQDTTIGEKRFLHDYIEKGSPGLQEYYRVKTRNIGGMKSFVKNLYTKQAFYKSIRNNLLTTKYLTDTFRVIFSNLKNWYPESSFPTTTFVVGGWSSGGTSTDYGAIVGADMQSADNQTITSELTLWQKKNLVPFNGMKHVVAHELIHVQQGSMKDDTTLLCYAIKEGMADFIGELISGKTANQRLHIWAKGREQKIWDDFKREMFLNRYSNWIANSDQETPDHPADLGYWVGYQICKAYFDQAINKKEAVNEMLNIKDYKTFLEKSKIQESIVAIKN